MKLPKWLENAPLPAAPESARGTPMSGDEFAHRHRTGGLSVDSTGRVGRYEHRSTDDVRVKKSRFVENPE